MGKEKKGRGKQGKQNDAQERLMFLHTIASWAGNEGGSQAGDALARRYNAIQRVLSQKQQIRIPPASKRSICKGCDSSLNYSVSPSGVRVRVRSKRQKHIAMTCTVCNRVKRYPVGPRAPKKQATKLSQNQSTGI
eukprot:TRINITY_DN16837_c0_g1_i1.p1 TRINITY_DN16837_c0_g1~~TRINITY_DN16837_c0_g1_i1.p1  ORF type:complete len:135 (-),score=17.00 TRINITY_DN16837_c0_g1_i1:120-524(-)